MLRGRYVPQEDNYKDGLCRLWLAHLPNFMPPISPPTVRGMEHLSSHCYISSPWWTWKGIVWQRRWQSTNHSRSLELFPSSGRFDPACPRSEPIFPTATIVGIQNHKATEVKRLLVNILFPHQEGWNLPLLGSNFALKKSIGAARSGLLQGPAPSDGVLTFLCSPLHGPSSHLLGASLRAQFSIERRTVGELVGRRPSPSLTLTIFQSSTSLLGDPFQAESLYLPSVTRLPHPTFRSNHRQGSRSHHTFLTGHRLSIERMLTGLASASSEEDWLVPSPFS